MGKSGVVAHPNNKAFGIAAGGVQSLADGKETQVPTAPDSLRELQTVPSVGDKNNSSTAGSGEEEEGEGEVTHGLLE